MHYAILLHDIGHGNLLLKKAHSDLLSALQYQLEGNAAIGFQDAVERIERVLPQDFLENDYDLNDFSLGETDDEVLYRRWCLKQRLFLNPLNDMGEYSIAAADVMHLPSIVVGINEGPHYGGFFNQMKQEFVSARFLLFEGITANDVHYSDREVKLINTLDYPIYSLAIEKVKIAFRTSYSLFDKIALFLNHYLELGLPEKSVSFKTIWYEKRQKNKGVRADIEGLLNNPLRGLFWLSKDITEKRADFVEVMEPSFQEIELLRQHAEHRYLKVHDFLFDKETEGSFMPRSFPDTLATSVSRAEFEKKAVKTMHLARNALIYLCLVIQREEERRKRERPADSVIMPMTLGTWEDQWKR